jgi:hypothetical protein
LSTARPQNSTWPESKDSSETTVRRMVVLPAPSGPISPKIEPRSTRKDTSRTASTAP